MRVLPGTNPVLCVQMFSGEKPYKDSLRNHTLKFSYMVSNPRDKINVDVDVRVLRSNCLALYLTIIGDFHPP